MNDKNQLTNILLNPLPEYVVIVQCNMTPAGLRTECCIVKKSEITDFQDAITASALIHNQAVVSCLEQLKKDIADLEADGHKWVIKGCKAVWEQEDRAQFMAQSER